MWGKVTINLNSNFLKFLAEHRKKDSYLFVHVLFLFEGILSYIAANEAVKNVIILVCYNVVKK